MTGTPHLSAADLLALLSLDARAGAATAERHAARCRACRSEVAHLRALQGRPRGDAELPGEGALLRAFALVSSAAPRAAARLRFAIPRLVFDSRAEPMVSGIRAPEAGRHLAWRGERADVEVRWSAGTESGAAVLTGQVLPRGERAGDAVGDVWLEERGLPAQWGLLAPSGEFTLPAPRGRAWKIFLRWGDLELRLAP